MPVYLALAGFPCAGCIWCDDINFSISGSMLVRNSLRSPRSVIFKDCPCFPRSWATALKPRSTKYDFGNAMKKI